MIVIDVEALGVDSRRCSLVSVGAVDFKDPERQFYEECRIFDGAHVEKEALKINGFSLEEIGGGKISPASEGSAPFSKGRIRKQTDREVVTKFLEWLEKVEEKTIAGHNPSFDRDFLQETAHRYHINWPLAHRTIDLHSICYFDMLKRGVTPPTKNGHSALNLDAILTYVGIPEEPKPHNALTGALVETEAFGRLFYEKPFLPEFMKYPFPKPGR